MPVSLAATSVPLTFSLVTILISTVIPGSHFATFRLILSTGAGCGWPHTGGRELVLQSTSPLSMGAELRTDRQCEIITHSLTGEKGLAYYLNMYRRKEPGHAQTRG